VKVCARGVRRSAVAAILILLGTVALAGPAFAATPEDAALAAPLGEFADTVRFTVTQISPSVVTEGGPSLLTIRGRMTNTGDVALDDLGYKFQRGEALTDAAAVDDELADPGQPIAVIQPSFTVLADHLDARAATTFTATVPIGGTAATGLAVDAPGVYPLMLNLNGDLDNAQGRARVGELHLLLTVLGVPDAAPGGGAGAALPDGPPARSAGASGSTVASGAAIPVGLFWPITDVPHLGVGGVFLNEDLAASIAPKGRLSVLLGQLTRMTSPRSFTVVIDPALLDELDRMTRGYRVTAQPGTPQPALTAPTGSEQTQPTQTVTSDSADATTASASGPTQTSSAGSAAPVQTVASTATTAPALDGTDPDATADTVAGTGSAAATDFLDRLRTELRRHTVLVLPFGNVDAVALVRRGMTAEVTATVRHGAEVADRVLDGIPYQTTVAVPPGGALDDATAAVLERAGYTTAVLAGGSVSTAEPAGAAKIAVQQSSATITLPAVVADSPVLTMVNDLVTGARGASIATRINALGAQLGQRALDGTTDPVAYLAQTVKAPNTAGTKAVADLLATMTGGGAVRELDPRATAEAAVADGTLQYPVSPADELPATYLSRWSTTNREIAGMRGTLRQAEVTDSPDPATLLSELTGATQNLGSAALRSDQQPGDLVLSTIDATLEGLREQVNIRSTAGSYTLTGGSSPLILTVRNDLPYVVRIRIELVGAARAGLTVDDPGIIELAARRTQQVRLPATVTRAGTFSVSARLVGTDGTIWGQPVELTIRSTAYGVLTVVLIVVAGGVLLLMVVIRIVQRVRGRGRPDQPVDDVPALDSITAAANDPVEPDGSAGPGRALPAEQPAPATTGPGEQT
jgi:hypothetical protein